MYGSQQKINQQNCVFRHKGKRYRFFLSLKIIFEILNPVRSYDKTNLTVFVLSIWKKDRWGLNSFGQYIIYSRLSLSRSITSRYPYFDISDLKN